MSDYRFGCDYRLNYDKSRQGEEPEGYGVNWDSVGWVEIDGTMFVAERTCTYDSAEDYSLVCSACGWNRRGALIIPNYCPHCGARVENANEDELAATHHRFKVVSE